MWSHIILGEPLLQVQKQHWRNISKCSIWMWLYAPSLDDLISPQKGQECWLLLPSSFMGGGTLDICRQTQSEPICVSPTDVYQGHLWLHSDGFLWGPGGGNSGTRCWPGSKGGSSCSMMGMHHMLHFPQYFDFFSEKESRSILRLGG